MFRSLATRLTAAYVFAAIVLVGVVVAAVTILALTMFGITSREASEDLARQVPEEVRMQVARAGSLEAAAQDIARHLARPGLHVAIFAQTRYGRRFLAATLPPAIDGSPVVTVPGHDGAAGSPHGEPPGPGPGGDAGPPPGSRAAHMRPYPFGLNGFLRLQPQSVSIPGGRVVIFPDPDQLGRWINAFWLAMFPIAVFVIAASWFLGRTIAQQALRPLVETTASLERFGAGDFTPRRVVTNERNEIGNLARAYNLAAAQVSHAFEERRAAELQMRQFVADAGHELRTPLTVLMGFIDVLRRRGGDGGTSSKIYETMLTESRRMKALIDKLILLARLENAQARAPEPVDLSEAASHVVAALQALGTGPRIALDVTADALVLGDEHELHDAIANLVENALKYAPESPVDVRVGIESDHAFVEVADRGPGIAADEQALVFDRFYRGRERGDAQGFGLGLAIAKRAVERAGGEIRLVSRPGEGSRFTIRLPRAARGETSALAV